MEVVDVSSIWALRLANSQLLTYSMVQSPSCEANWFAASQEIPRISRNPKVHYRTHKRPPPVSILGQPNPVHIPTSQLLEIHPNIISLSMLCDVSPRNTTPPPPRRPERRSSLPPDCFVSRASIPHVFLNNVFYREGFLAPRPTPTLKNEPSSAVRDCLFIIFAATLLIGGRSSIRNLRTRHAVVTGTTSHSD